MTHVRATSGTPRVLWQGEWTGCWLARNAVSDGHPRTDVGPCDGALIRAHLIPRQLLLRELPAEVSAAAISDERSWVPACGGPTGVGGHHGALDYSRRLRVPAERLPAGLLELAAEHGLLWWLEREYGQLRCDSCDELPPDLPFPNCKCFA